MLRDRHEVDKFFEAIVQLVPPMDTELTKIDQHLDDEVLFQLVHSDLSKRSRLTLKTGRNSTPVEVIRCAGFAGYTSTWCRMTPP